MVWVCAGIIPTIETLEHKTNIVDERGMLKVDLLRLATLRLVIYLLQSRLKCLSPGQQASISNRDNNPYHSSCLMHALWGWGSGL